MSISLKADSSGNSGSIQLNGSDVLTVRSDNTLTGNFYASSAENAAGVIENKVVDPLGIREAFNAGGSSPVYACRAWVNFNGAGTVAIRASGNVSSITDNGTGDYTINFATAMPDANYEINGTAADNNGGGGFLFVAQKSQTTPPTTTAVRIATIYASNNGHYDSSYISISIFR